MSRRPLALVLAAGLALGPLGLAACSSGDGGSGGSTTAATAPVDVGDVLCRLADDVIVPSYARLGDALEGLRASADAMCATPSAEALDATRDAWRDAVTAWQSTRAAGVGPALEERLMSDVGFAARETVIDDLLDSGDPVDPAALGDEGAAAKGVYAAEIALFGDGSDSMASTDPAGARRCQYAASVAQLTVEAAAPVIAEWTDGDARQRFVDGLDGGPSSSVALVVNEVSHRLEELVAMGLRDMAEADGIDDLAAARVGGPGDFRLGDRKALLAGISATIGDGTSGISALVGAVDADTRDRLVVARDAADEAMAALPDSVADAFDDPGAIVAASDAVAALKVILATETASKLGVTITFSDSDGDS